jgi:large subunit ribosomal protein L18
MLIMIYSPSLKRNRQGKTNYRKRAALLISKSPFITIKISDQNVTSQVLKATRSGDVVISSVHSRELKNHGWKGSMNSLPACYLTGLLVGKKSIEKGTDTAILYTGKDPFTTRIAACLKGIVAAGLNVPVSDKSLPKDDRISGEHIVKYAKILKEDQENYNTRFSLLLKGGLKPEDYPLHFEKIKMQISGKGVIKKDELEEQTNEKGVLHKRDPIKGKDHTKEIKAETESSVKGR